MRETIALSMTEPSQVGEARRVAIALAGRLGFQEADRGKVGLVVTELANNLVRYAQNGMVLLQEIAVPDGAGIEIVTIDNGPGIANIEDCLRDGYSTSSTPGNGLGAVQRLSNQFEIYSMPGIGTAMVAQLWPVASSPPVVVPPQRTKLVFGTVCLPKTGESVSGDIWFTAEDERGCLILMADGLGHGLSAAQASLEAVRLIEQQAHLPPKVLLELAHDALRKTRGAVLAIAKIEFEAQTLHFAGIGNIAGSILLADQCINLVSLNGTVGHAVRKIQEFTYPWSANGLLIMHSDGLGTQWRLDRYPGLLHQHPSLIAGVLYRDFNRGRDDVTVLVAREQ